MSATVWQLGNDIQRASIAVICGMVKNLPKRNVWAELQQAIDSWTDKQNRKFFASRTVDEAMADYVAGLPPAKCPHCQADIHVPPERGV